MSKWNPLRFGVASLLASLMIAGVQAIIADDCCLTLPAPPASEADGIIKSTWGPGDGNTGVAPEFSKFTIEIQPGGSGSPTPPIPPGPYAAWCFDVGTDIAPAAEGTLFGGYLLSSCDSNLNSYLPDHPNVKKDQATWKKINYLINHRFAPCNGLLPKMWEVQHAIFRLMGQTPPPYPPYPPFDLAVVQCLIDSANANAAAWQITCGDKIAVIFNIDVNWDNIAPEAQLLFLELPYCPPITCPTNATVKCDESLDPNVNVNLGKPTTDPCCPIQTSYVDSITSSNCPGNYVITRTWTASTSCVTNTCVQTITVTDTSVPVIVSVPPGTDLGCNPQNLPTDESVKALVVVTDPCGTPEIKVTHVDLPVGCMVTRTFTITAVDQCGNTSEPRTVIYTWKVDLAPPVLSGLPGTTASYQCLSDVPPPPVVTALDNCDGELAVTYNSIETGEPCDRLITRTWTARDACGNPASFTQTIIVKDTTAPQITCAPNKTVQCGQAWSFNAPAASDACGTVTTDVVSTVTNGTACNRTITRTWEGVDNCGNKATCSQTVTVRDITPPAITCPPDFVSSKAFTYCSYTPGGWGAPPNGGNPGTILANNFSIVYPGGYVEVGIPGSGGKSMKFTSASAIQAYLPNGGTRGALTSDLINPTTSNAGVFGQHVLALTLNVNFSAAGIIGTPGVPLGDLVLNDGSSPLNGKTINQILAIANIALGGGSVSSYGVTLGDLSTVADLINNGFDNCVADGWAVKYLLPAGSGSQPGTATATDNCDPAPVITYTDVVTQEPCGAITNRTWKATDACGNAATCVQRITTVKDTVCLPGSFNLNGSTSTDGTDGNVRTFTTTNGVSVKVSAWSRNKSTGTWSPAFLGQYGGGAGVTDNTEGSGSGNEHTVDNVGTDNFVLFEFSEAVVASQACLGYVVDDSDLTLWIGNFTDPFNNHLNLNDGVLGSFGYSENNPADSGATRCATFNASQVVGNALVIAAWPGDDTPEDKFKIASLAVCKLTCAPPPPPPPPCLTTICGAVLRDCNADGNLSGEEGLAGFTVKFRNSGGTVIGTVVTDADGDFCSSNLVAGTYTVEVVPLADYGQTYDPDGTKNNKTSVTLTTCQNKTGIKFGYTGTKPSVYLVKTGPAKTKVGETISYKFAVTNTGNTCLYGGMSIDDPMLGGVIWYQSPVVPGEGFVINKTYTIKASDPKTLCNTATAIGHPPFGLPTVTHDSSWTLTIANSSLPKPPCPTVEPGNCQVKLTCYGISGWSSFKVKRSTTLGGTYTVIKSGLTSTSYTDTTCANGGLYYYVVSCVVNGVESPNSDPASAVPSAGLPSPWQTKNIGSVDLIGGASYDSGPRKFSVIGSGEDIWNSSDEFRYVYQQASGNCTIVARVTSVGASNPWAKAGVMIRETLTAGSEHSSVFVTPNNGVAAQYRDSTGGTSYNSNTTGLTAPYWVKVVRNSNTFTAYRSSNGSSWTTIWTKTINMSSNVYIGLAVTSHDDGAPCAATFDNVSATP